MTNTTYGEATWRLGSAAVLFAFVLDPLGNVPNVAAFVVMVVATIQVLTNKPENAGANGRLLAIAVIIALIAALEILNPNVPTLSVGLVGFRKSATFVLGVAIGVGWRGARLRGLQLTWWCMLVAGSVSIAAHLGFLPLDRLTARNAGMYSGSIGGVDRMHGLFAGPFHVSMLGAFLVISALAPKVVIRRPLLRAAGAAVGFACVFFSHVRTGYVAVAVGALVMVMVTGSVQRWAGRLIGSAALMALAGIYIGPITELARSNPALGRLIESGAQDDRFTARFQTWKTSLDLVDRSPLIGWGSGSAGDTLGPYFVGGQHVSAHNVFLKYAVEGGLLQGFLFVVLTVGLLLAVRSRYDPTRFGLAAAVTIIIFASVGASVEAIPVSFGLAVIWGLCAGQTTINDVPGEPRKRMPAMSAMALDSSRDGR